MDQPPTLHRKAAFALFPTAPVNKDPTTLGQYLQDLPSATRTHASILRLTIYGKNNHLSIRTTYDTLELVADLHRRATKYRGHPY